MNLPSSFWPIIICAAALAVGLALCWGPRRVDVLRPKPTRPAGRSSLRRHLARPVWWLGAGAGAALGWVFEGSIFGLVAGAGAGCAAAWWLVKQNPPADVKERHRMARQFPLVLGFLASVVESGAPVRFAAEAVSEVADGPNAQRLRGVLAYCEVGFSDAEAWRSLTDDPVWGDVARELARCVESGAAVGDVLRAAARQADKTAAADAITRARSVGVTSTLPLVCCFLPAFLLVGVVPIIGGLIGGYLTGN